MSNKKIEIVRMRQWIYVLMLVALAGCFATTPRPQPRAPGHPVVFWDTTPAPETVDRVALENLADPLARSEPRSESGNYSPYIVLGQTYDVLPTGEGYVAEGLASWYGAKFHGRATASGETYDMYTLTAAHKTLPIPCFVRVTNLRNGKSTIVRVNDRGPFHDERLMDLSFAAAVKLGFDLQGTAPVRLEMVAAAQGSPIPRTLLANAPRRLPDPFTVVAPTSSFSSNTGSSNTGSSNAGSPNTGLTSGGAGELFLQAGAFHSREAAERMRGAIQRVVGLTTQVALAVGSDTVHRVRIGPLLDVGEANRLQSKLIDANFGVPLIIRD